MQPSAHLAQKHHISLTRAPPPAPFHMIGNTKRERKQQQDATYIYAFSRIYNEHTLDKIFCLRRDIGRQRDVPPGLDLDQQAANVIVVKGQMTSKHGIQYNSTRPDVSGRTMIMLALKKAGMSVRN